jgi:hypothetical protein
MDLKKLLKNARKLSEPYRVDDGKGFKLSRFHPGDTGGLKSEDKPRTKETLALGIEALSELQDRLYAHDRWSLLLIFQAMDAAGKDGAIKHVMSGVNPQGCQVFSFKALRRGAPARLPVAHDEVLARARPHRRLQPFVLRGGPDRSRSSGDPREPEAAAQAGDEENLEASLREHP